MDNSAISREVPIEFIFPSDYSSSFREVDTEPVERVVSFIQRTGSKVYLVGKLSTANPNFNYTNGVLTFKHSKPSYDEIYLAATNILSRKVADEVNRLMDGKGRPTEVAIREMGNYFSGVCPTLRKRINDWSLSDYSFRFSWKLQENSLDRTPKNIVLGIYDFFKKT